MRQITVTLSVAPGDYISLLMGCFVSAAGCHCFNSIMMLFMDNEFCLKIYMLLWSMELMWG